MNCKYVIGVDYGTDSCRAIVVDTADGREVATAVSKYSRWAKGLYCDKRKNIYRQHPLDYIESLESVVRRVVEIAGAEVAESIVGLSFDTTGSTPALIDEDGTPLALKEEFKDDPDAMFILWKDHSAVDEAEEINRLCKSWEVDYTAYEGGIYSSEWVWSKVLHITRGNSRVYNASAAWCEHCDWITALMTGNTAPETLFRSRCAAGHKAMWNQKWGGLPSKEFFEALDGRLTKFLPLEPMKSYTGDTLAGVMTGEWLERLGLSGRVAVSVGAIDAHVGAVGAEITPNVLTRIIGTSTCDIIMTSSEDLGDRLVSGICGQVDGSVAPGYIGLEAGQSAFGDIYGWFKGILGWGIEAVIESSDIATEIKERLIAEANNKLLLLLGEEAEKLPLYEDDIVSLDWFNGRRTPDANQRLKGVIADLTLGSTAPQIYKALVEATAFGSKAIVDRFREEGVRIDSIIAIGGISQKSPFVMQTLSDVLNMPIKVNRSSQTCALGAAMFAAVAAGVYPTLPKAQKAMGVGFDKEYQPDINRHEIYMKLYSRYRSLAEKIDCKVD